MKIYCMKKHCALTLSLLLLSACVTSTTTHFESVDGSLSAEDSTTKVDNTNTLSLGDLDSPITVQTSSQVLFQMRKDVEFLASDELEGRNTGTKGIEVAAEYLIGRLSGLGLAPYGDSFLDEFTANNLDAFNVVAVLPGTDATLSNEIVVIGAHYDHIGVIDDGNGNVADGKVSADNNTDKIANGANDNATGTATVLEIASRLSDYALDKTRGNKRTVVFALYSAEEMGLLGSKHLAKRMKAEGREVVAVLNFEMTGIPMVNHPSITYLTGHDLSNMAATFNAANTDVAVTSKLEQAAKFNLFKRSDNYPFYQEFKVPAHTFSTFDFTNFEHYHKVGDESSQIDFAHMRNVVDALMPGVERVINGPKLSMR